MAVLWDPAQVLWVLCLSVWIYHGTKTVVKKGENQLVLFVSLLVI